MSHRTVFLAGLFIFVAGCGGGSGGAVPAPPVSAIPASGSRSAQVSLTFTVPQAKSALTRHPASVDPATLSVSIVVNALAPQIFTASLGAPGCSASPPITCTVSVNAPLGADTFTVTTYSALAAGGFALDRGTSASVTVLPNTANAFGLSLSPVVSNNADSGPGSLRNAIANATPGDIITFILPVPTTISLLSTIPLAQNVTINGPGQSQLTIDGGGMTQLFSISAGANVEIENMTLAHGSAPSYGGAINNSGMVMLCSDTFTNNSSGFSGGAVYDAGTGLTIMNSTFTNNTANYGGAVIEADSAVAITGSSFSGNSAIGGGALQINGGFAPPTIDSDTFSNNTTLANSTGTGAAIQLTGSAPSTVISNSTFLANISTGAPAGQPGVGGAISSFNALTVTNDVFTGNGVNSQGPANGGAINAYGNLIVNGSTSFTNNFAYSTVAPNSAAGGAISVAGILNISGSVTFTGNSVHGAGSAYLGEGGAVAANAGSITGATFSTNSATSFSSSVGNGGAVFSSGALTISNSTFFGDSASDAGGGYYAAGAVTDTVSQSSFQAETIAGTGSNVVQGAGIATSAGNTIHVNQVTFAGNTLTGSTLADGAGFFNGGTATVTNSTFSANSSSWNGGGMSSGLNGGSGTIILSTFYGNSATNFGHNLMIEGSSNVSTFGTVYALGSSAGIQINGTLTSNGYNWSDVAVGSLIGTGDHNNTGISPNLGGLQGNGSLLSPIIPTLGVITGSGLINQIPLAMCAAMAPVDERGIARGQGAPSNPNCTIGAYEYP